MKKIILLTFLLVNVCFNTYCTSEIAQPNEQQAVENVQQEQTKGEESSTKEQVAENKKVNVKAKIVEAGEVIEKTIGSITNKVQVVKLEILEGEFVGKTYDSEYNLSYDLNNKILAYELSKGNSVFVELTQNGEEVTEVVVYDVVRHNAIIYMLIAFFVFVIVIGGKQGIKAIIALIITILAIYFVMIVSIYKGYSPILMSLGTSAVIIVLVFIVIRWNK